MSTILVSFSPVVELIDRTPKATLGSVLWVRALAGTVKALAAEVSMEAMRILLRCMS
jgi:hypothetical protein